VAVGDVPTPNLVLRAHVSQAGAAEAKEHHCHPHCNAPSTQQRWPTRRAAARVAAAAEKSVTEAAVKYVEANVDPNDEKEVQTQVSATGTGKAARPPPAQSS
jgi:NMD protein affecting ribosome stability and mRNA decay